MPNSQKGILFIILSQFLWGLAPSTIKLLNPYIAPSLVVTIRFFIASIILFCYIMSFAQLRQQLKQLSTINLAHIVLFGILGSGLADLFLTNAVRHAGAIPAALISRLEIPFTVVLAGLLLKETITKKIIIATLCSFGGVVLLSMKNGINFSDNPLFVVGIGFAFVAAFIWAGTNIYGKKILNWHIIPVVLIAIRLLVGAIFNLIVFVTTEKNRIASFRAIDPFDWIRLGYLGIFASALAYFSFYKGLQLVSASRAANFMGISIAVALVSGIFIGENLSLIQWLGIGAILMGIYLVIVTPPSQLKNKS